jgi:hypothetical protein
VWDNRVIPLEVPGGPAVAGWASELSDQIIYVNACLRDHQP